MLFTIDIFNSKWNIIYQKGKFYIRMKELSRFLGYTRAIAMLQKQKHIYEVKCLQEFNNIKIPDVPVNSKFIDYFGVIHILNNTTQLDIYTKTQFLKALKSELFKIRDNFSKKRNMLLDRISKLNLEILTLKQCIEFKKSEKTKE